MSLRYALLALLSLVPAAGALGKGGEPVCYYVSSYHVGQAWSDSVERGLRAGLGGRCRVEPFYMDTKRRRDPVEMAAAGVAAHERMLELAPDVVITSDDNAARHFIEPWLIGSDTPVVFTGINWTVEEYDLPAPNVTGMIEVAPMQELLELGHELTGGRRVLYLAADTITSRKDLARVRRIAREPDLSELDLSVDFFLADSAATWRDAWRSAQDEHDFILLGDRGALGDWDDEAMRRFTLENARILVLATAEQTMPYAAVGLTRIPEELGEWAAASAVAVLGGLSPAEIPLVTNRRWDAWINEPMIERVGLVVEPAFARKAKRIR